MTATKTKPALRDINIEEVFPHAASTVWKALTNGDLISRWLMTPNGFEPVKGNRFTFQTPGDEEWDGIVHCEVLEIKPSERFVFSWKTGKDGPDGYVSRLDTVVAITLQSVDQGTRLKLVHSGFDTEKFEKPFRNISEGWTKVLQKMRELLAEGAAA